MIFDLNIKPLNTDNILEKISDVDIYSKYIGGEIIVGRKINSPFRDDIHPSFSFSKFNGRLYWRDWGDVQQNKPGDVFTFVMKMFGISFVDALKKINNDFGLNLVSGTMEVSSAEKQIKSIGKHNKKFLSQINTKIFIEHKMFSKEDIDFWKRYGISLKTLGTFNVSVAKEVWIVKGRSVNNLVYKSESPIFIYEMGSYKGKCYKIYSPYGKMKWLTNCPSIIVQGYDQLPENGELLIITKSLKDVMVLYEMGYPAIAPQSETANISVELFKSLKDRFKNIILFYDNDETGKIMSDKISDYLGIDHVLIPNDTKSKDISDYVKDYSFEEGKILMKKLLDEKIHYNVS